MISGATVKNWLFFGDNPRFQWEKPTSRWQLFGKFLYHFDSGRPRDSDQNNPNWYKASGKNHETSMNMSFQSLKMRCFMSFHVISNLQKFWKWSENSVPKSSWGSFKLQPVVNPICCGRLWRQPPVWSRTFRSQLKVWREASLASKKQKTFNSTFILCIWVYLKRAPVSLLLKITCAILRPGHFIHFMVGFIAQSSDPFHLVRIGRLIIWLMYLPLWKIWVRQLGWLFYLEK